MECNFINRGHLKTYSNSALSVAFGSQTCVVDKIELLTWFEQLLSQYTSNQEIIENTRIFRNILWKLITQSNDFNEMAGRIFVAWDIFHWLQLKMAALTTDCKEMVSGRKWVDPIERSRTMVFSLNKISVETKNPL